MGTQKDFADLKFKAECSDIVLTNIRNRGFVIRGPGELWQDELGILRFKIFIEQGTYQALRSYVTRPGTIGERVPEDEFFQLEAEEHTLPRWNSARVMPWPKGGLYNGMACGIIDELVCSEIVSSNPKSEFVAVRFRGGFEFPCNEGTQTIIRVAGQERQTSNSLNVAIVNFEEFKFELRRESMHVVASLELPRGKLTASTPERIQEALQFALGEELSMFAIETHGGGKHLIRLVSPRGDSGKGRMEPPLQFGPFDEGGHVWRVFGDYFRYVHTNPNPGWHPVSRHIGSAVESTAASIDAEVLALAVAVEGIIGDCFPNLSPVTADFLAELENVEKAILLAKLTEQTQKRLAGTISQMRKPRNSDLLRSFIEINGLPPALMKSWSSLRNASAHGRRDAGREIDSTLRLKNEVLALLYSIVMAAIGYEGPRTDYSVKGWPRNNWPIQKVPVDKMPVVGNGGSGMVGTKE